MGLKRNGKIWLSSGGHDGPERGGCLMEWVSVLSKQSWTAQPICTNEVITRAAQSVNDRLDDVERQRLVALIPRIMRARRTDSDARVNVRLAAWAARSVLHLVREQDRAVTEAAVRAVEMWLVGECSEEDLRASYAAASASSDAAYASSYASSDASSDASYAASDPVAWLDTLLDVWEKAVNEEGEALWVPTEWEDEALRFMDEMTQENSE